MHFSVSLENMRRSPFQAAAAISTLALAFFVVTLISLVMFVSHQVVTEFEKRPQVIAFLTQDASVQSIDALRMKLEGDPRTTNVRFVTKEEALEIYRSATADNPLLGELVSPSVFPASIEFSLVELSFAQEVVDEISAEPIIDSVGFTANVGSESELGSVIVRLKNIVSAVRIGGVIIAGVLALNSFLVLTVVISLRVTTKRKEIGALSLIGATPGFVRAPILFEALNYAFLGVFIGWFLGAVAVLYSAPAIVGFFGDVTVLPKSISDFLILLFVILGIELLAGLLIAFIGSSLAVSRALRQRTR